MIVKIAEGMLETKFGGYRELLYYDGKKETIALVMDEVENEEAVLCRVHSSCVAAHAFNSIECECREEMEISQKLIQQAGRGIIIWLEQEGKGNGHFALLKSKAHKKTGLSQAAAYEAVGFKADARDFTGAAEILHDLKVKSIVLLTNNPDKTGTLAQFGVRIAGTKTIVL
jgi:GTP cyclohydrolase II